MNISQPATASWVEYDYAIVRVVPRVEIGTYVDIGVVVHARRVGFLDALFGVDRERISMICKRLDLELLQRFVDAYRSVCHGGAVAGPIGLLPPSERFHWLTSPRSAVLQTSPVHPGRCHDPQAALGRLFQEHCVRR